MIYIDLFVILNFVMDFIILLGTGLILRRSFRISNIIISSVVGMIVVLGILLEMNGLLLIVYKIVTSILMVIIAFGYRNIRYTINNLFYFYGFSIMIGGVIYVLDIKINSIVINYLILIVIGIVFMYIYLIYLLKLRNNYSNYSQVSICLEDNKNLDLIGFKDTGNNLYDGYKGRKIIIINNNIIDINKYKYLLIPYNTVNEEGMLKCIKIKRLVIDNIVVNEEVLLGVSNNKIMIDGVDCILHAKEFKRRKNEKNY